MGHNSVKNVGKVMVLDLCISSDDALYNFIYMLYITLRVIQDFQYSNFQRGMIT